MIQVVMPGERFFVWVVVVICKSACFVGLLKRRRGTSQKDAGRPEIPSKSETRPAMPLRLDIGSPPEPVDMAAYGSISDF
jgi:hypothetical protein